MEIDGPVWFVGALLICGAHTLYLRVWRREYRANLAQLARYDAAAQARHEDFMRALSNMEEDVT